MNLTFKEFNNLIKRNIVKNKKMVIPIYKEIIVDTETPVSIFLKITKNQNFAYLLESAETSLQWGRYSFISFLPYLIYQSFRNKIKITEENNVIEVRGDPFKEIKFILNRFTALNYGCFPRFFGGLVGYVGYENIHFIEPVVKIPKNNEFKNIPDIYLMFNKVVLIFDHYLNKLRISYLAIIDGKKDIKTIYHQAISYIEEIEKNLKTTVAISKEIYFENKIDNKIINEYTSNISFKKFLEIVKKAKNYIYEGDIIQVVLSRRLSKTTKASPFDIYRALRIINPSPYMFYLKFEDLCLIGSSPEILVRKENDTIETRPIAGTRPRGETEEEDSNYEKELLNSEKENAEHIMLVDLARNDVGKISIFGSISLPQLKIIEKFSHVMHLVSLVKGKLKKNYDSIDVLKACFPAGTVSGAPKVRAMQIISELENTTRGPYAGAVGYFSLTGNMDMAIAIRTIIYKDKKVYIQTGAGIVADSLEEKEFEETINKAKALILAVNIAEKSLNLYDFNNR